MSHPEDKSHAAMFVELNESMLRESFKMAQRILTEAAGGRTWESVEARERYMASAPLVALDVKGAMVNVAHMTQQANPKEIDSIHEAFDKVIAEMRKKNQIDGAKE